VFRNSGRTFDKVAVQYFIDPDYVYHWMFLNGSITQTPFHSGDYFRSICSIRALGGGNAMYRPTDSQVWEQIVDAEILTDQSALWVDDGAGLVHIGTEGSLSYARFNPDSNTFYDHKSIELPGFIHIDPSIYTQEDSTFVLYKTGYVDSPTYHVYNIINHNLAFICTTIDNYGGSSPYSAQVRMDENYQVNMLIIDPRSFTPGYWNDDGVFVSDSYTLILSHAIIPA
jgi:hypothetical protein